jgi:hypothetical protein
MEFYVFIDVEVHDTCGESGTALTETQNLLNSAKENDHVPLIGKTELKLYHSLNSSFNNIVKELVHSQ